MGQTKMDTKMRAVAAKLCLKFGKSVTLTTLGDNSYDVTTGSATPSSTKTKKLKGVIRTPNKFELDSGLAVSGDSFFIVPASGLSEKPEPSDKLLIDGVTWKIIGVAELFSGEQVCIYSCHIRS